MRESSQQRAQRAREVLDRLIEAHPDARIALSFGTPLELLVAVVLSAQCTDARVNQVTPAVFRRCPTPASLAASPPSELEAMIRSCGLYRAKAKALIGSAQAILEAHGGRVPTTRAVLATLPGVGNKSAGVIAMHLSGERAFPVDTHVARVSRRLGFTRSVDPDKVEADLRALLPPELWMPGHHALIFHGRRICLARSPACARCPVEALCPKVGVRKASARRGSRRTVAR